MKLNQNTAYLSARTLGQTVHMRLGKEAAALLYILDLDHFAYVRPDRLTLGQALYECVESALLWYIVPGTVNTHSHTYTYSHSNTPTPNHLPSMRSMPHRMQVQAP
jgi:hypothetical protein